ncbi:MAG: MCE family protein [Chthoniobacterales bacterium]|nr:MCE family protein [Chthoniobacterales bacterium]
MSAKPDFYRIGLFIVGGIVLLVAALLVFGGGQMFRQKIAVETYIQGSVQGIDVGSPVKFRGVLIGKVTRISFAFTEYHLKETDGLYNYVVLFMEINREVFPNMFTADLTPLLTKSIEQGMRVRIEPQGITGLNYLDIDYFDPMRFPAIWPSWKPTVYYIPSAPGELTSFVDSINGILREVEKLNINGISQTGTELLENLNKAVVGAQVGKISEDLQTLIKDSHAILEKSKIPELSANATNFLRDIESSNRELRKILKNIEPATRLSAGQVREIMGNLAATTSNLEQLSSEVKNRPSLLLWGSAPKEPVPKPTPAKRPQKASAAHRD